MSDVTSDAPHRRTGLSFAETEAPRAGRRSARPTKRPSALSYPTAKRLFDLVGSLVLLPVLVLVGCALLLLNPVLNRGSVFFVQERMGRDCRPFQTWKFRTMLATPEIARGPFDELDSHRITRLGQVLRKTRLDELPQVINVVRGEMSLIGPRPDYYPHACTYVEQVAGYRERHTVLPGITGFAQVEVGYVDGLEGVRNKVAADLHYLRHASFPFDLWITWRTILTVLGRRGL